MDIYKLLSLVSDPTRLKILFCLDQRACTVREIEVFVEISQANTSKHLKKMYECGVLEREQKGKEVTYFLSQAYLKNCVLFTPLIQTFSVHEDGVKIKRLMGDNNA